jgi:hypothetical protein
MSNQVYANQTLKYQAQTKSCIASFDTPKQFLQNAEGYIVFTDLEDSENIVTISNGNIAVNSDGMYSFDFIFNHYNGVSPTTLGNEYEIEMVAFSPRYTNNFYTVDFQVITEPQASQTLRVISMGGTLFLKKDEYIYIGITNLLGSVLSVSPDSVLNIQKIY